MGSDGKIGDLLQKRLIDFGARTTRVAKTLPRTDEGRYIAKRIRAGHRGAVQRM
jgi:hypothetical protein